MPIAADVETRQYRLLLRRAGIQGDASNRAGVKRVTRFALGIAAVLVATGAGQATGQTTPKPCTAKSLSAHFDGRKDGVTEVDRYVLLRNRSATPCSLTDRPAGASVFVADGDFHNGYQVTVQRAQKPPARVVLRRGQEALLVLTYPQVCLPPEKGTRTYLALALRGPGSNRDLSVDAPSEPMTLDGGALRQCQPLTIGSYSAVAQR